MLRKFQVFVVLGVCLASISARAQDPDDEGASKDEAPTPKKRSAAKDPAAAKKRHAAKDASAEEDASKDEEEAAADDEPAAKPSAKKATSDDEPSTAPPPTPEARPAAEPEGWRMELHGYFRAPMALGLSSRPGPDDANGPAKTQVSYGPNRTIDANYYSFAYTRLQETDWAEVFIHAKKKHVDAAVGWMGYWFQGVGVRNYDAAWAPGLAYITLDTDLSAGDAAPNIAFTAGAFWPKFGYFEKYDTYTLGRFRQLGEQLKLTAPVSSDLTLAVVEGFGTGRDGTFNPGAPAFYGAQTSLDLLTYENVELSYKKVFDIGLHYNTEWTADPTLYSQTVPGDKSYTAAHLAHLTTIGGEATVNVPYAGSLWVSPSFVHVRNGWALANAGTEVMHSLGGAGVAGNYLAYTGSPTDSTGSGSLLNFGFLYENTLSGLQGKPLGSVLPDVKLNVFGLITKVNMDLPATTTLTISKLLQFKYGADVTVQTTSWLGVMLRYDFVNYETDLPGFVFAAITPRLIFSSHFLSSERIYLQYSRYIYGDKMVLAGKWPQPWNQQLIAGSDVLQGGPYSGKVPDKNIVKLQAEIAF